MLLGGGLRRGPNNGDAEFQKMLEATKQVKSFRGTYGGSMANTPHAERLWEVDCNRGIVHKQSQELQTGANALEMKEDEFWWAATRYTPAAATDRGRNMSTDPSSIQPVGIATTLLKVLFAICCRILGACSGAP